MEVEFNDIAVNENMSVPIDAVVDIIRQHKEKEGYVGYGADLVLHIVDTMNEADAAKCLGAIVNVMNRKHADFHEQDLAIDALKSYMQSDSYQHNNPLIPQGGYEHGEHDGVMNEVDYKGLRRRGTLWGLVALGALGGAWAIDKEKINPLIAGGLGVALAGVCYGVGRRGSVCEVQHKQFLDAIGIAGVAITLHEERNQTVDIEDSIESARCECSARGRDMEGGGLGR